MSNDGEVAVVGAGGRIGTLLMHELLRRDIPVGVASDMPNLDGMDTADALVRRWTRDDPSYGQLPWEIDRIGNDYLRVAIGGKTYGMKVLATADPASRHWAREGISLVEECTGACLGKQPPSPKSKYYGTVHLDNGAQYVIVSAPTDNGDASLVMGINHETFDPATHHFVDNGSCTTKAVGTPLAVMYANGIRTRGTVSAITTHAETGKELQALMRGEYDLSEAEIREYTSGAYKALAKLFGELIEACEAFAFRVPTGNGSSVVVTARTDPDIDAASLNNLFRQAARDPRYHGGIHVYEGDELLGSGHIIKPNGLYKELGFRTPSAVISPTRTLGGGYVQFVSWYNNERAPPENQARLTEFMLERLGRRAGGYTPRV